MYILKTQEIRLNTFIEYSACLCTKHVILLHIRHVVGVAGYLETYSVRQILQIGTGVLISP
jgi:hypothetical protein